jgi:hypothetical protein
MNTWQKIAIGIAAAIAWGAALWVGFAWPTLAAPMAEVKMLAQNILSGLGLYHLLITPPPVVPTSLATPDSSSQSNP